MHEVVGGEDAIELGFVEKPLLQHQLAHAPAGGGGLPADHVALVEADDRVQVRHDADGIVHVRPAHVRVGRDALDAQGPQGLRRAAQQRHRLEQALRDDRLHHVELQLTRLRGHRQRQIVAEDLEAHLVDHLRDDRVDLRRHDRRPRLPLRQVDLVEARARPGGQQTQVVAHLRQLHRRALEGRVGVDVAARVGRRVDEVLRRRHRQAGDLAERLHHRLAVSRRGVDARADRRRPQVG